MERGRVLACQFHPELSGAWGGRLIGRWLRGGHRSDGSYGTYEGTARTPLPRVIPCLDVRDGRIVKGVRFADLRDAGDPAERAALYEAQGADEIVILDVSATPEGRRTAVETVRRVRGVLSIPLTVGGGVRAADDAAALLDAGADKVSVNTAAVERPALIAELAERFGAQCTVLAIDAAGRKNAEDTEMSAEGAETERGSEPEPPESASALRALRSVSAASAFSWEVVTRSGSHRTGLDAVAWARRGCELGAGEVLLTSFDRDGTREGYDLGLLRAVSAAVPVPLIASGGADTPEHLKHALDAGADAVLAASIFHDGQHTVADVKFALAALGVDVRMPD
ncbi:MAG: imidazole glycerol phosphate synthase subunit HisF [Phycisphaeraceae bacterium]|nr:imidazole glycerol phosphate synthase subunit HisF [Phycisphaeraceae bacterium]